MTTETVAPCEITVWLRARAAYRQRTAERLAAEILAAVSRGDDLPEEWYRRDAYADAGEPESDAIVSLVREGLLTTGIRL